jgi:cell division septation protein DedD
MAPPPVVATSPPAVRSVAAPAPAPPMREPAKPTVIANSAQGKPAPQPSGTGWTVQLGSFASRANAERLVGELKAKGYAAFSTESGSGGRILYRVRVGPAPNFARRAIPARLPNIRDAHHGPSHLTNPGSGHEQGGGRSCTMRAAHAVSEIRARP